MTSIILLVSQDTVYVVCGGIITIHFANKYIQANDINDSYKEFNNQDQVNFNGKIVKKTKKEKLNSIMKEKGRSQTNIKSQKSSIEDMPIKTRYTEA